MAERMRVIAEAFMVHIHALARVRRLADCCRFALSARCCLCCPPRRLSLSLLIVAAPCTCRPLLAWVESRSMMST